MIGAEVTWAAGLSAVGAIITPTALALIGYLLNRRLKKIEDHQWRGQEFIAARLRYYREIAEPLNDLMCYFTFVGTWKERTPPEVVALKRSIDRTFHTLAPYFSLSVARAYNEFMDACFDTFGSWGADARLKTNFRRRQPVSNQPWRTEWNAMFTYGAEQPVPATELERVKSLYNEVLARLVGDIQLMDVRTDYASAQVVLNA